jgi:ABC-type multidrug transport system permease subunit
MLRVLLAKDLRRVWRNPLPWMIHLAVPLVITALIGLAFGRSDQPGGLGRIKLAVVDEDDTLLTQFLQGALNQKEAQKYLEPFFLKRAEAMGRLTNDQVSAAVVIPAGFTRNYLLGREQVTLEVIKNPAQSFYPAMVEETMAVGVAGLNALARNFQSEFPAWQAAFERPGGTDAREIGRLIERAGNRFEAVREYVIPPRLALDRQQEKPAETLTASRSPMGNVFAFLLPGMAALFLLFQADNATRDLYREQRFGTLDRYRTLQSRLYLLLASKMAFVLAVVGISSVIILGGGSAIFRFHWQRPGELAVLVLGYGLFAGGFMALVAALSGNERRADMLNNLIAMGMGLAGGCMFPHDQLPALMRQTITPWMPTRWLVQAANDLQSGTPGALWWLTALKLAVLGAVLMGLAARLFQRRLEKGIRA